MRRRSQLAWDARPTDNKPRKYLLLVQTRAMNAEGAGIAEESSASTATSALKAFPEFWICRTLSCWVRRLLVSPCQTHPGRGSPNVNSQLTRECRRCCGCRESNPLHSQYSRHQRCFWQLRGCQQEAVREAEDHRCAHEGTRAAEALEEDAITFDARLVADDRCQPDRPFTIATESAP